MLAILNLNQKGLTTLEVLMLTPLVLFLSFILLTMFYYGLTKTAVTQAAREGHRVLAVTHDINLARSKVEDSLSGKLTVSNIPGTNLKTFNPATDIILSSNANNHFIEVRYRMIIVMPGIDYRTIITRVEGHREIGPRYDDYYDDYYYWD